MPGKALRLAWREELCISVLNLQYTITRAEAARVRINTPFSADRYEILTTAGAGHSCNRRQSCANCADQATSPGRRLRPAGEGVDDEQGIHQPARGSPA